VIADLLIGTVIIVANESSTIDIPPGSVLENVVVQGSLRSVPWSSYLAPESIADMNPGCSNIRSVWFPPLSGGAHDLHFPSILIFFYSKKL